MKKLLLLSVIMTLSLPGWAKIKIGDLYYELDSYRSRAEVTYYSSDWDENANYVSGSIIIPSQVQDGNNDYSVLSINGNAFRGCNALTSIELPNSIETIGEYAFHGCSGLKSIEIPNTITEIQVQTFYECTGLTNVVIPNSVIRIAGAAFYRCTGLTSIVLPNSVTDIGNAAFYGCSGLKKLSIGENLEIMGGRVFDSCDKLEEVLCYSEIPPTQVAAGYPFSASAYENVTLYVPQNSLESYMMTTPWSNFLTIKPLNDSGVDVVGMDTSGSRGAIYNINGQIVKRQASQTDINALTPGIYIIGRMKVLIK